MLVEMAMAVAVEGWIIRLAFLFGGFVVWILALGGCGGFVALLFERLNPIQ